MHIFYRVTCYYTEEIIGLLKSIDCPKDKAREAYNNLVSCKLDTGVTYSNYKLRKSVMVISKTSSPEEFFNSLKHECRHLEDHIATAFKMPIGGEEVAYLAGYLGRMLYEDVQLFICVIVKTCSDKCFTVGQKNCQMFVAKLHKFHHPHNRMRFYPAHSVLSFHDFAVDTFLPQRFLR